MDRQQGTYFYFSIMLKLDCFGFHQIIMAMPYDTPVPGFNNNVNDRFSTPKDRLFITLGC
jgi:hypothetical protein